MMKLLLILCVCILVAGDVTFNRRLTEVTVNATSPLTYQTSTIGAITENVLRLKKQIIPSNGTGVVIWNDIGGYLGPEDGLVCTAEPPSFISPYWLFPNGSRIIQSPHDGVFGVNRSTCVTLCNSVSLYYSGKPMERGKFMCISETPQEPYYVNSSVYIVDMEIIGPGSGEIAIAGEDVYLSVNVTTSPRDVPVPYQWLMNGMNLPLRDDKYKGRQNNTLTIFKAQVQDEGMYSCSVAHSPSGRTKPVNLTIVSISAQIKNSPKVPSIGHLFTLTCDLDGDAALTVDLNPQFVYTWTMNGLPLDEKTSIYVFKPLMFHDSGHYKCLIDIKFDRTFERAHINSTSQEYSLKIPDVIYRIYFKGIEDCHQWTDRSTKEKASDTGIQIIHGILSQTECDSIPETLTNLNENQGYYSCPVSQEMKDSVVIYDFHLRESNLVNTTLLVSCLDQWIQDSTTILVHGANLQIIKECTKVLDTGFPTECSNQPHDTKKLLPAWHFWLMIGIIFILLAVIATIFLPLSIAFCCLKCGAQEEYQQPARLD